MPSGTIALILALLAPRQEREWSWRTVELPPDEHLDLTSAEVRLGLGDEATLALDHGRLASDVALARLEAASGGRPRARVQRGEGEVTPSAPAEHGAEYLFDLGEAGWGYLRVLGAGAGARLLELARAGAGEAELVRDPPWLEAAEQASSVALSWEPLESAGAEYEVRRRLVGPGAGPAETIATVRGASFVDAAAPRGRLLEYEVSRRAGFGSRARALLVARPHEWPLELRAGMTLDLLSGVADGERAHLEILRPGPRMVTLRPLGGTLLGQPRNDQRGPWTLTDQGPATWQEAPRAVPIGGEVAARLPEGVLVRLAFDGDPEGEGVASWLVELEGGPILPRPPEVPATSWQGAAVGFAFEPLEAGVPEPAGVSLVVERELAYRADDWRELALGEPGERALLVPTEGAPLVARYRFRHRAANGALSRPSRALRVLHVDPSDPASVDALIDEAFERLASADYGERVAARGLVDELGEAAWPRLIEALRAEDPELASAARELLAGASDDEGLHIASILRARAVLDGVHAPPPPGWTAPEANARAAAILRALGEPADEAQRAARAAWLGVLARADTDAALRALATLLRDRPAAEPRPRGLPYALLAPGAPDRAPFVWSELFLARPPAPELARRIGERLLLEDPRLALVQLEVLRLLELRAGPGAPGRADVLERAELALRLVERARNGDRELLQAAERLCADGRARLEALERLATLRLGHVPAGSLGPDLGRERRRLAEPTLDALESELEALSGTGASRVDLVLPAGVYGAPDAAGSQGRWIDLRVRGLRLLGEGQVVLHAGLRAERTRDLVLEGLELDHRASQALLLLEGSSLVARDCVLRGRDIAANVIGSTLELDRTRVAPGSGGSGSFGLALRGESVLLARDSLLESGTLAALSSDCFVYLERCVLDGGTRHGYQGQQGAVVLRDVLLRSGQSGLVEPGEALLAGVVIAAQGRALQGAPERVRLCPERVVVVGQTGALEGARVLDDCPR